ncbi:unnamed protein product [Phytophthora fragariaefolia]|uniref:Unnamed protein product n=1 Tax=Phytophthora fragariaefolia TaxID=1490495 RepID=A0A9W6YJ11_9STRA|nr:unnamed protein product [Phytophthora fragariaefolia]
MPSATTTTRIIGVVNVISKTNLSRIFWTSITIGTNLLRYCVTCTAADITECRDFAIPVSDITLSSAGIPSATIFTLSSTPTVPLPTDSKIEPPLTSLAAVPVDKAIEPLSADDAGSADTD